MAARLSITLCALVVALAYHTTSAQWFNTAQSGMFRQSPNVWGQASGGWGQQAGMWGRQANRQEYETCIGKNTNGDEIRVTFSQNMDTGNAWARPWGNTGTELRVQAVVTAGQSSNLMGNYQLVVTQGSRVEEGCLSEALGDILGENMPSFNMMFGQRQRQIRRGVIGNTIFLTPGQSATSSETVDQLSMREIRGRGLALCRAQAASGDRCFGLIPLCCKIGIDSQPATTPFNMQGQFFGQNDFGMQNTGMGGLNMNQGLAMGMSQGMNQGALPQGVNQALPQNLPGGLNTGLGQGNTAGQGLF